MVITPACHVGYRGSIPLETAKFYTAIVYRLGHQVFILGSGVRFPVAVPIYRGLEKEYLEGLISPSLWCDSRTRNQQLFRRIRARRTDLTVNQ